jgi:hypothetical protein
LQWEVDEQDNTGFYIEHSFNGKSWESIAFVGSDNHAKANNQYSYTHVNNSNGNQYYRIKQVNKDGKESYSDIRTIALNNNNPVFIWPNPATDQLKITTQSTRGSANVQIFDLSGRMVSQKQLQPNTINSIAINSLPTGTYIVKVETGNGVALNQKITKQ